MSPQRIGLILVAIAIAVKFVLATYGMGGMDQPKILFLMHVLFILLGAFFSIAGTTHKSDWIDQFRAGMRAIGTYAIIYAIYLYIHNRWIDPMFLQEYAENFADSLPANTDKKKVDIPLIFEPFGYSTLTLMAFLATGAIYTFLVTALERRVLSKIKR